MTRRCSHCSNNGHNSRTCPTIGGVKLFGVRLTDGSIIKKSASMGNLSSLHSSSAAASPNRGSPSSDHVRDPNTIHVSDGYLSDDPAHATCSTSRRGERKKGVAWTEEEHRLFLLGLQKIGKGDWRGISRNFVTSRTPTQVASHAQKYFIRHTNSTRRKRRSSLFDMVPNMDMDTDATVPEEQILLPPPQPIKTDNTNSIPSLNLSLESMEASSSHQTMKEPETEQITEPSNNPLPLIPTFYPYVPISLPFWPLNLIPTEPEEQGEKSHHQVIKPIPIKERVNVDELVGMSQLNLGENGHLHREPSPLSLKLIGASSSRQSAFHASTPANESDKGEERSSVVQAS